jgi:hypothetical protein
LSPSWHRLEVGQLNVKFSRLSSLIHYWELRPLTPMSGCHCSHGRGRRRKATSSRAANASRTHTIIEYVPPCERRRFRPVRQAFRRTLFGKSTKLSSRIKMHSLSESFLLDVPSDLQRSFPFYLAGSEKSSGIADHRSSSEDELTDRNDTKIESCDRITIEELINAADIRPSISEKHIARLSANGSKSRLAVTGSKSRFFRRIQRAVQQLKSNRRQLVVRTKMLGFQCW